MKTATQNLEDDHVYILKLTDIMMAITRSDKPGISHIETVVDIIKNFADGLHHAKEEELLFPKLEEKGFSASQGPVAVMLHEHVEGRNFVKGIVDNIDLYKHGSREAMKDILVNMLGYADLLRNHIAKENNILFRMADKVLSANEQDKLVSKFEEIENNRKPGSAPSDYISSIKELAVLYDMNL
jgi:hemerythrin-like domain-containing protein